MSAKILFESIVLDRVRMGYPIYSALADARQAVAAYNELFREDNSARVPTSPPPVQWYEGSAAAQTYDPVTPSTLDVRPEEQVIRWYPPGSTVTAGDVYQANTR